METHIITLLLSVLGFISTILCGIIAWLGNRIYAKVEEICSALIKIEGETKEYLHKLDKRVSRIEDHVFPEDK